MDKLLRLVVSVLLLFYITGCKEVVEIEGNKEIRINEFHTYEAVIVSETKSDIDSYKWRVISKNKDYTLKNENTSKVTFSASSVGKYTLEVKVKKNKKSTKAKIEIVVKEPEIINGYVLPPEPDEKLNNSTLLGIDSNDNGVRDDVEIYVIKRYAKDPDFPKTKTALALQYAWATQKILENPTIESSKYEDDAIDCQYYWFKKQTKDMNDKDGFEYRQNNRIFGDSKLKDKIYNTRERIEQKFSYNAALSGNIFDGRKESIDNCQINIDELGE